MVHGREDLVAHAGYRRKSISHKTPELHFEVIRIGGSYDGKINADTSEIAGQWKQGGASLPLILKRVTPVAIPHGSPLCRQRSRCPYPQFGGFGGDAPPYANSSYHALQIRLEKRFSSGLQFLVTYAFSKAIDNASATDGNIDFRGDAKSHLQDPNNFALEKAISPYDSTHVFQISHVYELPVGRGKAIGANWNPVSERDSGRMAAQRDLEHH